MTGAPRNTLSVVMPVFNEEGSVARVVADWRRELDRTGVQYEFLAYDDGSTDGTAGVLLEIARDYPVLRVRRHRNMGHGPTILRGYREAAGDWVFQTDSDGELDVTAFRALWAARADHDFLLGYRVSRVSPLGRRFVSACSRASVALLFGRGLRDVNTPFRLMRSDILRDLVARVPEDTFAPNVILSGLAVRTGLRVHESPVEFRGRTHGASSLGSFRVLVPAARAFRQTLAVAWSTGRDRSR